MAMAWDVKFGEPNDLSQGHEAFLPQDPLCQRDDTWRVYFWLKSACNTRKPFKRKYPKGWNEICMWHVVLIYV